MSYGKEDLYDIIDTIISDELKPCERETHYNRLLTALDRHFNPQQMKQTTDNISNFYHELRQLVPTCNFVNVDTEIKSQITVGCNANKIQEKGLTNLNITLQELLQLTRTLQLVNSQAQ